MKLHPRTIILTLILPLILLACSEDSNQANPTVTTIENNIIGNWVSTDINANSQDTWQFLPDGTFTDTAGATFQYKIYEIGGFTYVAFNAEDLNIEPSEELIKELEDSVGNTDFIPIYEISMPSPGSLIIEPATRLYGSDSYFGFTFQTNVLRRQ